MSQFQLNPLNSGFQMYQFSKPSTLNNFDANNIQDSVKKSKNSKSALAKIEKLEMLSSDSYENIEDFGISDELN